MGNIGRGFMAWIIGFALLVVGVAAYGWIAGQLRVDFVRIHTSIEIDADKHAVWAALADLTLIVNGTRS